MFATGVTPAHGLLVKVNQVFLFSTLRSKRIARSFARPANDVFAVVKDVGDYSHFMPFCSKSLILEETDRSITAELTYGYNDMKECVLFNITWEGSEMLTAKGGETSFCKSIVYDWRFYPSRTSSSACLVQVDLSVDFTSGRYAWMFDVFGNKVQDRVIQSFSRRLDDITSQKIES